LNRSVGWLDYIFLAILASYLLLISAILPMNFDEAHNLQVPIMIAREGRYETIYPMRSFDAFTTLTLGPTVQLPIALAFRLFGVGLLQARMVRCLYLIAVVCMLWIQCVRSYGRVIGLAVLLLWYSMPNQLVLSLWVLGEVPAIFFVWLGMLLWARGTTRYQNIGILVMGFSVVTKLYFGLVLLPVAALITVRAVQTRIGASSWIKQMVVAGVLFALPAAIWEIAKFAYFGPSVYPRYLAEYIEFLNYYQRQTDNFGPADRLKIVGDNVFPALHYMITVVLVVAVAAKGIPDLLRGARDELIPASMSLLVFITGLVWFVFFFPLAWWRYLFAFSTLFLFLLGGLIQTVLAPFSSGWLRSTVVVGICTGLLLAAGPGVVRQFKATQSFYEELRIQKQFAAEVDLYVQKGYKIGVSGWWHAPEIAFLAGGMKFLPYGCGQERQRNLLVIYTKLEEAMAPRDAAALTSCLGRRILESADHNYALYVAGKN